MSTAYPLASLRDVRKTAVELAAVATSLITRRLDRLEPLTPDEYRLLYGLMADVVDQVLTIGEAVPNP